MGMTQDVSAKAAPKLIGSTEQRPLSGTVHLDSNGGLTNLPGSPNVAPGVLLAWTRLGASQTHPRPCCRFPVHAAFDIMRELEHKRLAKGQRV